MKKNAKIESLGCFHLAWPNRAPSSHSFIAQPKKKEAQKRKIRPLPHLHPSYISPILFSLFLYETLTPPVSSSSLTPHTTSTITTIFINKHYHHQHHHSSVFFFDICTMQHHHHHRTPHHHRIPCPVPSSSSMITRIEWRRSKTKIV